MVQAMTVNRKTRRWGPAQRRAADALIEQARQHPNAHMRLQDIAPAAGVSCAAVARALQRLVANAEIVAERGGRGYRVRLP